MSTAVVRSGTINVLVLLDKSASMMQTPAGDTKTKWAGALDALQLAINENDSYIKYGLVLFPYLGDGSTPTCQVDTGDLAVNVPVSSADQAVNAINALAAVTTPGGGSPTAAALEVARTYFTKGGGAGLQGTKYVLLVTDGGPNCNAEISGGPDTCTANVDHTGSCGTGVANCCDPSNTVMGRPAP